MKFNKRAVIFVHGKCSCHANSFDENTRRPIRVRIAGCHRGLRWTFTMSDGFHWARVLGL
jgi:hypothetical protein